MKSIREIFGKIAYSSFYLAVVIEVLIVIVDKSAYINPIEGRLFQITFLFFTIKTALTKYSWKEYLAILLFLFLGAISYFVTGRNEIVRVVMFIAACKDIDMQKCLKLVFYMTIAGCVVIMLLSLMGIYGDVSLTQDYGRGGLETRYTLGLGHPNALQCMVWALTTLGLYLYGEKMKWYYFLLILAVNVGFFFLTDSRTALMVSAFVIVYAAYMKYFKSKFIRILGYISGAIMAVSSIVLSVIVAANAYRIYNYVWHADRSKPTQFFVYLDRALTGRIRSLVGTTRFEGTLQTWSLFSSPANNYYFDMGWIRLFYWYGIIPSCIFIFVIFVVMLWCYRTEQYMAFVMMVSFCAYTLIEAHAVSVYIARNYTLFLIGAFWYKILSWEKTEKSI